MSSKDSMGDRFKTYENVNRHYLTRRVPLIIRLDGAHFHTYTRGFDKPWSQDIVNAFVFASEHQWN